PGVRAERLRVVVRPARPLEPVLGDEVPLLARDLAGLAADAERRVGEEADARLRLVAVGVGPGGAHVLRSSAGSTRSARARFWCACDRSESTNSASARPRGRRPGLIPQESAFTSWMWTFGSRTIAVRS